MPLEFLTQAEHQRYQQLPTVIAERYLRQYFQLSETDLVFVAIFCGATHRLGMGRHLGLLRYQGCLPDAWGGHMPAGLRVFVAGQLSDGALVALMDYRSQSAFCPRGCMRWSSAVMSLSCPRNRVAPIPTRRVRHRHFEA